MVGRRRVLQDGGIQDAVVRREVVRVIRRSQGGASRGLRVSGFDCPCTCGRLLFDRADQPHFCFSCGVVRFLSGSPLFARLSDCPYTAKVRALSDGLGGGEKRVTQKLEDDQVTK